MYIEKNTRTMMPPEGGIFLCQELIMPARVEALIQGLPEILDSSSKAKPMLDDELEKLAIDYEAKLKTQTELSLTPDAVCSRLFRQTLSKGWTKEADNLPIIDRLGHIENLKSAASAYEDARSTICGFGELVVDALKPELGVGSHLLGSHHYEVVSGRFGGQQHTWLCGFDEGSSQRVYFNRWDAIEGSLNRPAHLRDYIKLLGDLSWLA